MTAQRGEQAVFPVDDCFGVKIDRPFDELVAEGQNHEELVSFEEFIRGASKRRNSELDLRPIDEDTDGDGFFDVVLDGGKVPEDPMSEDTKQQADKAKNKRSELYEVSQSSVDGFTGRHRTFTNTSTFSSATTLRHSFCPTVGEGGGWLSGRTRRESEDSAAYGYEPPEEPYPAAKMAKMEQRGAPDADEKGLIQSSSSRQSMHSCPEPQQPFDAEGGGGEGRMVQSNSFGELMFSKFLCCFRALNPTHLGRGSKKCGENAEGSQRMETSSHQKEQQHQQKCYSWDKREECHQDPKDFCFAGLEEEVRVKEPGQLNGQPFQIENCVDSLIVLLDRTASITVDDTRNCVILAGPCQGSIFLRDCNNVIILAVCQQFRTRDCRQLVAHLFCATGPAIEETDLLLGPLLMNYSGLQTQVHSAGLSPFVNRWNQVHNFTPNSGKCHVVHGAFPTVNSLNYALIQRFRDFLSHSPLVEQWNLSIGNLRNTRLFVDGNGNSMKRGDATEAEEERVLVLLKPTDGSKAGLRFYADSVELTHALLDGDQLKLVAMHDIDLRPGEWETVMQHKQQKPSKQATAKLIAIELHGKEVSKRVHEILSCFKSSSVSAQLVGHDHMELYRKNLYRLCEIRQSI